MLLFLGVLLAALPQARSQHRQPDIGSVYFVDTRTAYHHNPWSCNVGTGCTWPDNINRYEIYSPTPTQAAFDPVGWMQNNHFLRYFEDGTDVVRTEFAQSNTVVTRCLLSDNGGNLNCDHRPPSETGAFGTWPWRGGSTTRLPGRIAGETWQKEIHRDRDRSVIAAVCLTDSELEEVKAALDPGDYTLVRPRPSGSSNGLFGWNVDPGDPAYEAFGRGWTDTNDDGSFAEPARIARWDEGVFAGKSGTAEWLYPQPGTGDEWELSPWGFFIAAGDPATPAMTEAAADSCFDDDPCGTAGVSEVQVCQCAANVNADRGRAVYPWVGSGGAWFRAYVFDDGLDTRDLELFAFDERGAMYQVDPMPAGVTPSNWPDDHDDEDKRGKPMCYLPR